MEHIYEYFLETVECKFARNDLTNWKTFLTNILKNIIWHLFAGESHQDVKITVPYFTPFHLQSHYIDLSNKALEFWLKVKIKNKEPKARNALLQAYQLELVPLLGLSNLAGRSLLHCFENILAGTKMQ